MRLLKRIQEKNIFKFCELDEVYATVKYTDGSIQEKVKIKILDENGQN